MNMKVGTCKFRKGLSINFRYFLGRVCHNDLLVRQSNRVAERLVPMTSLLVQKQHSIIFILLERVEPGMSTGNRTRHLTRKTGVRRGREFGRANQSDEFPPIYLSSATQDTKIPLVLVVLKLQYRLYRYWLSPCVHNGSRHPPRPVKYTTKRTIPSFLTSRPSLAPASIRSEFTIVTMVAHCTARSRIHLVLPSQCYQKLKKTSFTNQQKRRFSSRDAGLDYTAVISFPKEVAGPEGIPSRAEQIKRLQADNNYDILIIGGGATGAGCALDAASRGLKVACIERGDFASETSSRSTKLIWAGIRYLATAAASLLTKKTLTHPVESIKDFMGEMKMVVNCHRERRYMMEKQGHLCNWIPIAIPFRTWYVSPPPFGHALFSFFPILAPFVLKIYDGMSSFRCPPSYILTPTSARKAFPQLTNQDIKYCAVFYEAQHNDARTNLAIALSAAEYGAHIANYVEMTETLTNGKTAKVTGIKALDRMTGTEFEIKAKKIIFCGGPFTDEMRKMEAKEQEMLPAVRGASGTHIVLPGYYCPPNIGLLDYNTSDGRFLFFLPWQGHTLVGTTDTKNTAETSPSPPEDEVQWILNECSKYLRPDLQVRRSDVLSAWRGWRPLAADPHASPGDPVSRDHVISENPQSGIIFIAGGKWTTWREMAEEVIDRVDNGKKCRTLEIPLFGGGVGYSDNLSIGLIQKYGMSQDVARHLANTYGLRAWEVCTYAKPTSRVWPRFGVPLCANYPYIDAEVIYACREYACTIEDVLSRRTRLAFLNKDAAMEAIPVVARIMAEELGWSSDVKAKQMEAATVYISSYGGRIPNKAGAKLREATYKDISDIFHAIDTDGNGYLDHTEIGEVAAVLGFPLDVQELSAALSEMDTGGTGRVTLESFELWWNHKSGSLLRKQLAKELQVGGFETADLTKMGSGVFLG